MSTKQKRQDVGRDVKTSIIDYDKTIANAKAAIEAANEAKNKKNQQRLMQSIKEDLNKVAAEAAEKERKRIEAIKQVEEQERKRQEAEVAEIERKRREAEQERKRQEAEAAKNTEHLINLRNARDAAKQRDPVVTGELGYLSTQLQPASRPVRSAQSISSQASSIRDESKSTSSLDSAGSVPPSVVSEPNTPRSQTRPASASSAKSVNSEDSDLDTIKLPETSPLQAQQEQYVLDAWGQNKRKSNLKLPQVEQPQSKTNTQPDNVLPARWGTTRTRDSQSQQEKPGSLRRQKLDISSDSESDFNSESYPNSARSNGRQPVPQLPLNKLEPIKTKNMPPLSQASSKHMTNNQPELQMSQRKSNQPYLDDHNTNEQPERAFSKRGDPSHSSTDRSDKSIYPERDQFNYFTGYDSDTSLLGSTRSHSDINETSSENIVYSSRSTGETAKIKKQTIKEIVQDVINPHFAKFKATLLVIVNEFLKAFDTIYSQYKNYFENIIKENLVNNNNIQVFAIFSVYISHMITKLHNIKDILEYDSSNPGILLTKKEKDRILKRDIIDEFKIQQINKSIAFEEHNEADIELLNTKLYENIKDKIDSFDLVAFINDIAKQNADTPLQTFALLPGSKDSKYSKQLIEEFKKILLIMTEILQKAFTSAFQTYTELMQKMKKDGLLQPNTKKPTTYEIVYLYLFVMRNKFTYVEAKLKSRRVDKRQDYDLDFENIEQNIKTEFQTLFGKELDKNFYERVKKKLDKFDLF
jgi:hypothetical protein